MSPSAVIPAAIAFCIEASSEVGGHWGDVTALVQLSQTTSAQRNGSIVFEDNMPQAIGLLYLYFLQSGRLSMNEKIEARMISRRSAFWIFGGVALGVGIPAAVLPASDAEADTPGTERRRERRTNRHARRHERRTDRQDRRQEGRTGTIGRGAPGTGSPGTGSPAASPTGASPTGASPTGASPTGTGTTGPGTSGQTPPPQ